MVTKAVVLAAGLGKRFGPVTRAVPKPMLPIGGVPVLDYVIEELLQSGIQEIAVVVGHKKEVIMDYYRDRKEICFIVQERQAGTGDAILQAESFTVGEPFAVCLADEIVESPEPCTRKLIEVFQSSGAALVTALEQTTENAIRAFNSVETGDWVGSCCRLLSTVEKPQGSYPSLYTSIGRYVASPCLFDYLRSLDRQEGKELYATDALNLIMKERLAIGYRLDGRRWELGTVERWLAANNQLVSGDQRR